MQKFWHMAEAAPPSPVHFGIVTLMFSTLSLSHMGIYIGRDLSSKWLLESACGSWNESLVLIKLITNESRLSDHLFQIGKLM